MLDALLSTLFAFVVVALVHHSLFFKPEHVSSSPLVTTLEHPDPVLGAFIAALNVLVFLDSKRAAKCRTATSAERG